VSRPWTRTAASATCRHWGCHPTAADWTLYFPDPDSDKDPALLVQHIRLRIEPDFAILRAISAGLKRSSMKTAANCVWRTGAVSTPIIEKVSRGKDRLDFQPLSQTGRKAAGSST